MQLSEPWYTSTNPVLPAAQGGAWMSGGGGSCGHCGASSQVGAQGGRVQDISSFHRVVSTLVHGRPWLVCPAPSNVDWSVFKLPLVHQTPRVPHLSDAEIPDLRRAILGAWFLHLGKIRINILSWLWNIYFAMFMKVMKAWAHIAGLL